MRSMCSPKRPDRHEQDLPEGLLPSAFSKKMAKGALSDIPLGNQGETRGKADSSSEDSWGTGRHRLDRSVLGGLFIEQIEDMPLLNPPYTTTNPPEI